MKSNRQPGTTRKGQALENFVVRLSDEDAVKQGGKWRVLRNKSSLRIITLLNDYDDQFCVSEIAKVLKKSPGTISAQLRSLYHVGCVIWEDHGNYRYYRLRTEAIAEYRQLLEGIMSRR